MGDAPFGRGANRPRQQFEYRTLRPKKQRSTADPRERALVFQLFLFEKDR